MEFSQTERCPETFRDWSDRARAKCTKSDQYHCVEDEFVRTVEVCVQSIWIEPGHCPVYNTNAKKMDSKKCFGSNCPLEVYSSDDVYKYDSCQPSSLSTTLSTKQTIRDTIPPTTSSNGAVIAVPVIGILFVIVLSVVGVILWKRKEEKELLSCLQGTGTNPNESEQENTTENEPLNPGHEDNPQINNEVTMAQDRMSHGTFANVSVQLRMLLSL
uniref:Uncharacterized protein LOC111108526 n=1 Tax=Crassostrea virginica TaxID=6565 RepID=A0A8B8BB14_CRAVI|nr:uncharacterized protein LOC111108526 [Crassostrea virginica]